MFDWGREVSFGSNYLEVQETERSRNKDFTEYLRACYKNSGVLNSTCLKALPLTIPHHLQD